MVGRLAVLVLAVSVAARAGAISIEGETYARVGGPSRIRRLDRESGSGGKVMSYWDDHGVWAEWDIEIPRDGTYAFTFRYGTTYDTARRLEIDGKLPHKTCEEIAFPSTGGYPEHSFLTVTDAEGKPLEFALHAGMHTLRMTNVNSKGLAIDVFFLHDPSRHFADVVLGSDGTRPLREFALEKRIPNPVLSLHEMCKGTVRVLTPQTARPSLWVAHTLFLGQSPPAKQADVRLDRTQNLLIRYWRDGDACRISVTDGQALYWVTADANSAMVPLPCQPEAFYDGENWRAAATWKAEDGSTTFAAAEFADAPSRSWRVGNACITGTAPIQPAHVGTHRTLGMVSETRVAAFKFGPQSWVEPGLEPLLESNGARDVLHAVTRHYPGLAAFYEYTPFRIEFQWKDRRLESCQLTDLGNGQQVQLAR